MRLTGLALCSSTALALCSGASWANETINVGMCVSWPGYAMLKVASEKGLIPGYDLNLTIFEDPLGGQAALASGQLDVYGCTADYIPVAVDAGGTSAHITGPAEWSQRIASGEFKGIALAGA